MPKKSSRRVRGSAATNDAAAQQWPSTKVRDWLLAVLRFALTLEQTDREAVLATASALDHCGGPAAPFSFFAKTSAELCAAIADRNDPKRAAVLKRHLTRIEDRRLRRTFEAAIDGAGDGEGVSRARSGARSGLWTGLAETQRVRALRPL